jgi:hypothetical protein
MLAAIALLRILEFPFRVWASPHKLNPGALRAVKQAISRISKDFQGYLETVTNREVKLIIRSYSITYEIKADVAEWQTQRT